MIAAELELLKSRIYPGTEAGAGADAARQQQAANLIRSGICNGSIRQAFPADEHLQCARLGDIPAVIGGVVLGQEQVIHNPLLDQLEHAPVDLVVARSNPQVICVNIWWNIQLKRVSFCDFCG